MKNLYLTSALALLASPALADITPEELWESWQNTVSEMGSSLTAGQQERQGNVLVLHDVKSGFDMGFFVFEQSIDTMRLEALGDGSVAVSYDTGFSGTGTLNLPDVPSPDVSLSGQFEGTHGIVTGTADDYVYDFTIGLMQMDGSTRIDVDGIEKSTSISKNTTRNLAGQIHYARSEAGLSMSYAFTVASVENWQNVTTQIAGREATVKQSQQTSAERYDGEVSFFLSSNVLRGESSNYLPEGMTMDARLGIEHFKVSVNMTSPAAKVDMEVEQGPGEFALTIDDENISLTSESQNVSVSIAAPQMGPAPLSFDVANGAVSASVPLRPRERPQEASYALSLGGLMMSDSIWAILDPNSSLSHAPADFSISTVASITLLLDWTNIETTKAWEGPVALLHQIKLEGFQVAFENAMLSGEGTIDFAMELPDAPEANGGAQTFVMAGIPALLDKLGGLPLVNPSIIAGAKGMLGAFTSAGEGDTLTSMIEFSEGGHVSINGQQVR